MTLAVPLSAASLFELYKKEKEALDDELNTFPTFAEWKKTYAVERDAEMEEATAGLDAEFFTDLPDLYKEGKAKAEKPVKIPDVKPAKVKKKGTLTNMDKARIIYRDMFDAVDGLPVRKDVMEQFMKRLKVSKACASTYHHNIKQKYS